jgi:7-cyano-7-deazaguanine synthase
MKEIEKELLQLGEDKSCVLLFSGGIDSTILLFLLKKLNYKINVLTINYNGRNPKELEACEKIIDLAKPDNYIIIDLNFLKESITLWEELKNSTMKEIISNLPSYYIPARNIIFFSIAAYYAESFGASFIFTGHVKDDSGILPDVNERFVDLFNEILKNGTYLGRNKRLEIKMPFLNLNKLDLAELALKYEVPLQYTWSCHELAELQCGNCRGCIQRRHFLEMYDEIKRKR